MLKIIAVIVGIIWILAASYDHEAREMNWLMVAFLLLMSYFVIEHGGYQPGDQYEDPRR
jgi:hypothetical protein